jgi:hypothetical protein
MVHKMELTMNEWEERCFSGPSATTLATYLAALVR